MIIQLDGNNFNKYGDQYCKIYTTRFKRKFTLSDLKHQLIDSKSFISIEHDKVLGFMRIKYVNVKSKYLSHFKFKKAIFLSDLAVGSSSKGVGTKLMKFLINLSNKLKMPIVTVPWNDKLLQYYTLFGFQSYYFKDSKLPSVIMVKPTRNNLIVKPTIESSEYSAFPKPLPQSLFKKLLSFLKNIKDKIKRLFESDFGKSAKMHSATMNATDSCLTAILKIINRKDLIDKCRGNSHTFLTHYEQEGGKFIKLTSKNYTNLQKGHIIVLFNLAKYKAREYSRIPLKSFDADANTIYTDAPSGGAAHFEIILNPDKRLVLHNSVLARDRAGNPVRPAGTGLTLDIVQIDKHDWVHPQDVYVLDYDVIKKMKCKG